MDKHSLIFGFYIIKRENLIEAKDDYLEKQKNVFKVLYEHLSNQIEELKSELQERL